ncbi:hypothetical protein ACH4PU_30885 [Streptomyces sp. NPDC021100]|uniref:hypothetical protein n=1 Tax=Streptomyces sp. NPDC021100 TaxID=3365114 RepID=UPI0037BA01BB
MRTTHVFHYDHAPVRVRVRHGQPLWFARDLAAALGVPLPPGPLHPQSPTSLPGLATTAQIWAIAESGGRTPENFRAWVTEVSAQILPPPAQHSHRPTTPHTAVA